MDERERERERERESERERDRVYVCTSVHMSTVHTCMNVLCLVSCVHVLHVCM